MRKTHPLAWQVGFSAAPDKPPAAWVPAAVPGAVQLDWARAKKWPPYYVADHAKDYRWMEDTYWTYRTRLKVPALKDGQHLFFVCRGIDYRFRIKLDNRLLHEQEGMFTPVEIDLTGRIKKGSTLTVVVYPVPKSRPAPDDRIQANQSCKPAVSYGWDFHPRLVPLGIWDETYLEIRPAGYLQDAEVRYELTEDCSGADVCLEAHVSQAGRARVRWRLFDPQDKCVINRVTTVSQTSLKLTTRLDQPQLWWPNGQGRPVLYRSRVELLDAADRVIDRRETRVGFRRIRLVMNPGTWHEPARYPLSRSHPPITLEVNGRQIFGQGANWVPPHIFPGATTAGTYRPLLDLAGKAHFNLLRVWGGGPAPKENFFDLCDERGLMVWQEFPLACNRYEGTPHYLKILDQESRSIITRLRRHASLALWCGGNELFNGWSRMTDQDLALRLLDRNCFDLDPGRPFLMTSPVSGMGHGNYIFRTPAGQEVFQLFAASRCTAYTEFGCGGPIATLDMLQQIIPEKELYPPLPGTAWETHHAFRAWIEDTHLPLKVMEHYFGPQSNLDEILERGHMLQSEGLKCLFEEARRQKPYASMALNWCFNEPWLTAANCSIVSWPAAPKPAYQAVAGALRPILASAKIPKFRWQAGEMFSCEMWLLNDSPTPVLAGRIEAWLELGDQRIFLLGWDITGIAANTNLAGPIVRHQLPETMAPRMTLQLRCPERPERDSRYTLLVTPAPETKRRATQPAMNVTL
jgi:beta-mannosidase